MKVFTTVEPCQASVLIEEIERHSMAKMSNASTIEDLPFGFRGTIYVVFEDGNILWTLEKPDEMTDENQSRPDQFLRAIKKACPRYQPKTNLKQLGLAF